MRSLLTNGLAVLFLTMATTTVTAAGPFGLFNHHSNCCDQANCDSQCGCDSTGCDSCEQASSCCESSCCDSDCCDSGCDSCCDSSRSCGSICKRDFCCCCPRPCTYWSLFGGWTTLNTYEGGVAPAQRRGDFDDGWAIGIARGRNFDNGIRGELEFSYRRFSADSWSVAGVPGNWDGDLNGYFSMANLYRDFCNCEVAGFMPYVGGGIGVALLDGSFDSPAAAQAIDNEFAFAYQGMAGVTKRISCNIDAFTEYRYVGTTEVQIDRVDVNPDVREGQYASDMHGVMFGIRIWR